jgi:hypothetical protein
VLTLAVLAAGASAEKEDLADPLPLRRVVLPAARLDAYLRQVREGVLRQMPRRDFDALVRSAALAVKQRQEPPTLVQALYRASLTDSPALVGTAEWKVVYRGAQPALLRLQQGQPFNLAIARPRYDNREALVAEFPDPASPGKQALALLVDQPGQHTVTLDWSARAEARPEGLQVDLRLPLCQAGKLELNLPADHSATTLDGSLVSGPHDAESADRKLWNVAVGGRTHVPLLIRRGGPGRTAPVLLARQKTVQKLTPDGLESSTVFAVEVLHQDVRELTVEFDPILRPVDVSAPYLEDWTVRGGKVVARFERAMRELTLRVRSLAPLSAVPPPRPRDVRPAGQVAHFSLWQSPGVSLAGAVPRGETLELWLHPELSLGSWNPGDYRLVDSSPLIDPPTRVTLRRLVLEGGGLARPQRKKPLAPARPSALVQVGAVEYHTRQLTFWRLGPGGMEVTAQLDYQVRQGLLFQLPLRLPAGWDVESVDLTPPQRLLTWGIRAEGGASLLLVDLRRPFRRAEQPGSASAGRLLVRLRPTGAAANAALTGRNLHFPDPVPLGARIREGGFALGFDSRVYQASLHTTSPGGDAPSEGPWGHSIPDYFYPYTGIPLSGFIRLQARAARFRARAASDVFVTAGRAGIESRLVLEGESGHSTAVDVYLAPGAGNGGWDWRVARPAGSAGRPLRSERLVGLEVASALAGLSARDPLAAALVQAARPHGTFWRLRLDPPLPPGQSLTLQARASLSRSGANLRVPGRTRGPAWQVPLPLVLGASRSEGEVTLHLGGATALDPAGRGLREGAAPQPRVNGWRTFRYGDIGVELTLRARNGNPAPAPGSEAVIEQARLTTTLSADGNHLRHHFRFRLARWPQRTVPIRLPEDAELEAAAVDGHWLNRLRSDDGSLDLPVPGQAGGTAPRFEVLYRTAVQSGFFTTRLEAPAPVLPVPPTVFERRWLLPPDLAPLSGSTVQLLPGDDLVRSFAGPGRRLVGLLSLPLPGLLRVMPPHRPGRQALTDAVAAFKARRAGQKLALDDAVEDLAFAYLKDAHPLLVDQRGLAQAGANRATVLAVPGVPAPGQGEDRPDPWEAAGLVLVPVRAGALLTSLAQAQRWQSETGEADEWPATIEDALAAAARDGRDSSGRFLSALEWLGDGAVRPSRSLLPGRTRALEGWTAWQPLASSSRGRASEAGAEASLMVVRQRVVLALGLLAGFALAGGLVLSAAKARRGRLTYLLLWLLASGFLLAWLPAALAELAWWPLLAGLLCAGVWFLAWAFWPRPARTPRPPSSSGPRVAAGALAVGVLLVLGLMGLSRPAHGQKPQPDLVVLVPAATPDKETALLTPNLVDRLRDLARPAAAPTQGVVLASALYEGKLVNGQAEFTATLHAHALSDEPATLELPLGGLRLTGEVLVDGARAFPVSLPAPKTGYALKVKGKGAHKIELRFQTAVTAGEGQSGSGIRLLRFSVPRLAQSRLVFRPGPGASHLQAPVKNGSQTLVVEPTGPRLEVELGAVTTPVLLRWYQEVKPPRPVLLTYREAYLWSLAPDASSLTAYLRYLISSGATSTLQVALPAGLEVRAAVARRPAGTGSPDTTVRLSDWTVVNNPAAVRPEGKNLPRLLRLEMPGPVSGEVELTLELVPRGPWGDPVRLPLPRPFGKPAEPLSFLAYRAAGLKVERTSNFLRISGIPPQQFAPFWPAAARLLDASPPGSSATPPSVYSFSPGEPGLPPVLELKLRPERPRLKASQHVTLRVGPRQAELSARVSLEALQGQMVLVEWLLQSQRPIVLTDVTGPDVRRWAQHDNRMLVWLAGRTRTTRVDLAGWVPLSLPAAAAAGKKPLPPPRLGLPGLFPVQAENIDTHLTLVCEPGLRLEPQQLKNLVPRSPGSARPLVYSGTNRYQGVFRVLPARPAPPATIRTEVARRGKDLVFATTILYQPDGETRPIEVRLRHWEGEAWLSRLGQGVSQRRQEYRRRAGRRERIWVLDVAPGRAGPTPASRPGPAIPLVLQGRLALDEARDGVLMPDVSVLGTPARRVVVVDSALGVDVCSGMQSLPAAAASQPGDHFPAPGRQAWLVSASEWCLRLVPQESARPEVRVLLAEQRSQFAASSPAEQGKQEPSRWLHEGSWWLWQDGPSALEVTWPDDVCLLSAVVDDQPVALLRPEQKRLWLPLSGPAGLRHVRVRWRYAAGQKHETLSRPDLTAPRLSGADPGPTAWTVEIPPGWQLAAEGQALRGPSRRAMLELYRARAQLASSRLLLLHGPPDDPALVQTRSRLERSLRLAGLALEVGAVGNGPDGQSLAAWRSALRGDGEQLRQAHLLDRVQPAPPAAAPWTGGPAVSWVAESDVRAPSLRLVPAEQRQAGAVSFSALWLAGVALVWVVPRSRMLRALVRWLWPEAVLLAGLAAAQVVGLTATVVLLVLGGVVGRLVLIALGLRRLGAARQPAPGSSARG